MKVLFTGATCSQDPAQIMAEAEQLSLAMLTALERLNPVERAVLLLREVFRPRLQRDRRYR